jgi:hypothetical protein
MSPGPAPAYYCRYVEAAGGCRSPIVPSKVPAERSEVNERRPIRTVQRLHLPVGRKQSGGIAGIESEWGSNVARWDVFHCPR